MNFIHYTDQPNLTEIHIEAQGSEIAKYIKGRGAVSKPYGFWVSVGDAWKEWCEEESFRLEKLKHQYEVRIADDANILYLRNPADIAAFEEEYLFMPGESRDIDIRKYTVHNAIAWDRVIEDYDGIIVDNYDRFGGHIDDIPQLWYMGWDCSSGCIWNLDAIASFSEVH